MSGGATTGGSSMNRLLPGNIWDALLGANNPSASNVFATMADLPAAGTPTWSTVLGNGNTSGGHNAVMTSGDRLVFSNSGFTASISEPTLAGNIVLTLPSSTGTLALLTNTIYGGNGTIGTGRQSTITDTLNFILTTALTSGIGIGTSVFAPAAILEVRAGNANGSVFKGFNTTGGTSVSIQNSTSVLATFGNSGLVNLTPLSSTGHLVAIGSSASVTAKLTVTGRGSTSATTNFLYRDLANTQLFIMNDLGHAAIGTAAPTSGDRLYISTGSSKDGAINVLVPNANNNGYGMLVQGSGGSSNFYGYWADITGGTANGWAFRGTSYSSGVSANYGGYFAARNGTSQSIGVYGIVPGGDTVNSTDSAGVFALNQSASATSRKALWAIVNSPVNNGSSYAGNFEVDANGTNAVNYGVRARANGSIASGTNYAGWFQADGGLGATNYAIVTNGGNIGFGTTTPSNQALLELVSTSQAFLIMRMTAAQAGAITPANGMMVYVTDTSGTFPTVGGGFYKYQAGAWLPF